ncbi:MAG: hypothetical protein KatS3mg014_1663 [Actinomycetota bacterium]|nr:MAG: hypothetical protein KatS3mg014_1663 [Actinomycetota bacterium]
MTLSRSATAWVVAGITAAVGGTGTTTAAVAT